MDICLGQLMLMDTYMEQRRAAMVGEPLGVFAANAVRSYLNSLVEINNYVGNAKSVTLRIFLKF